jgi:hypothetical protein
MWRSTIRQTPSPPASKPFEAVPSHNGHSFRNGRFYFVTGLLLPQFGPNPQSAKHGQRDQQHD